MISSKESAQAARLAGHSTDMLGRVVARIATPHQWQMG